MNGAAAKPPALDAGQFNQAHARTHLADIFLRS